MNRFNKMKEQKEEKKEVNKMINVIHWMSLQHNPYEGINPGINVYSRIDQTLIEYPGIFCVPETMPFLWGPCRHRDLQVTLQVPYENLEIMKMGKFIEKPSFEKFEQYARIICSNDDNAIVVMGFDPSWIKKLAYGWRTNDDRFFVEEINRDFWR